jgi:hypothetical protein
MTAENIKKKINKLWTIQKNYARIWYQVTKYLTPENGTYCIDVIREAGSELSIKDYKYIIEQTPIWALKTTIAGIVNAICPQNSRWFSLSAQDDVDYINAKDIENFIYENLENTDFYGILNMALREFKCFGSFCARKQIEKDKLLHKIYTIGSYAIDVDKYKNVDAVAVKYDIAISDLEKDFGFVPAKFRHTPKDKDVLLDVLSARNINGDFDDKGAKRKYIEYYISGNEILAKIGYDELPFLVARDDYRGQTDGWGVGSAVRAIGNIVSIQSLLLDFCSALEEQFDPAALINQELFQRGNISFKAGAQNYVNANGADLSKSVVNARQVQFNYEGFFAALTQFQNMCTRMLDADIFISVSGANKQMTAYETATLNQEKILRLGSLSSVISEQLITPLLKEYVEFYYYQNNIPKKQKIKINYIGALQSLQNQDELRKYIQGLSLLGNIGLLSWVKQEKIPTKIFRLIGINTNIIKSPEEYMRDMQAQAQMQGQIQQAQQEQTTEESLLNGAQL